MHTPLLWEVRNDGDTYTITGSAAADENVAVELLAAVDGFSGIPGIRTEVADLKSKTASGSFWYNLPYFVANLLNILAKDWRYSGSDSPDLPVLPLWQGENVHRSGISEHYSEPGA